MRRPVRPPSFTIRRIPDTVPPATVDNTAPSPVAATVPDTAPAVVAPTSESTSRKAKRAAAEPTGGRFRYASGVLAFIGSAFGAGLTNEAAIRKTPEGDWWTDVSAPPVRMAGMVRTAGGTPYTYQSGKWLPVSSAGVISDSKDTADLLDVGKWPISGLSSVLAETVLVKRQYTGAHRLDVIVPGALGKWVLRRAAVLKLSVVITPVLLHQLGQDHGEETGALILQIEGHRDAMVPRAFVHSLASLPYTLIGEPVSADGPAGGRLLVDVRRRLPLAPALVHSMVPDSEIWALGPSDVGHWHVRASGEPVDGALLMQLPDSSLEAAPKLPPAALPRPIEVTLVPRSSSNRRIDAALIDETEIVWLSSYLRGRPVGETSFLLPGDGVALLTSPGGLSAQLPFGRPLHRVGPGGLYLETGTDFSPPLPEGARQSRFQLGPDNATVVTREGVYRFALQNMVPAWALWVGSAPVPRMSLTPGMESLLSQLSSAIREAEARAKPIPPPNPLPGTTPRDRPRLLDQAQRAEFAGNLIESARLLEQAGYPGQAGRMYERAVRGE